MRWAMHVLQRQIREMHAVFWWEPEVKDNLEDLWFRCVIKIGGLFLEC